MKKIVSAIILSAAAVSAPAFATGFQDGRVGDKYAAVDLGSTSYPGGSATAFRVGGGYQVHPAVAVEVSYMLGGKYTYSVFGVSASTELNSLQIMAVGNYNFGNGWGAFAKAGIAHNSFKSTVVMPFFGAVTGTASSNDLSFAVGGKYEVAKDIQLRAQYQETGVSSVNVISVGAEFHF